MAAKFKLAPTHPLLLDLYQASEYMGERDGQM